MLTLALRTILWKRKGRGRRRRRGGKKKPTIAKVEPSFPNIPEEIVLDILSRLPVKSLVRFKCVSKQWFSLISDSSITPTKKKVLAISASETESCTFHSIDEEAQARRLHNPWKTIALYHRQPEIFGSCNGLLLIRVNEDLFLWNPLTGNCKKVVSFDRLKDDDYRVVSGLCYDSSANEYKAVMALAHQTPSYGGAYISAVGLKSKHWSDVGFRFSLREVYPGPVVNGNLHWFACKNGRFLSPHHIFYFNPQRNEYVKAPMPEPKQRDGDAICCLGDLDGCLCMARWEHPNNFEGNLEVLAMKEYGVRESWTTMFILSDPTELHPDVSWPLILCSRKNGEDLMEIHKEMDKLYITAYNHEDNSHRDIQIPNDHDYVDAVMYEESLVINYNWDDEEMGEEPIYEEMSPLSSPRVVGEWGSELEDSEPEPEPEPVELEEP